MQVKVKTVLNKTHPIPGFRYASVRLVDGPGEVELWGEIEAHVQRRGRCSVCAQAAATYDHLARREWTHVGVWGLRLRFAGYPAKGAGARPPAGGGACGGSSRSAGLRMAPHPRFSTWG